MREMTVAIKAETESHLTIGGYGVVWGGEDLEGEHFTPETDFWFDRITETPVVIYEHGEDAGPKKTILGRVINKVKDDVGLWIEAQLDKSNEYIKGLRELLEKGLLGWSAGAVSHLVERSEDGKIISWPTAEFSLTPQPAEPRTLGVQEMKALSELEPAIKSYIPAPFLVVEERNGEPIFRFS